ncbi:MAG: polysaccharide deacetylase [Lachnospiraceae bacterium]|jgi:hypothetical protein|nr:polysaccharide deacetylase [Lachnospiraceae bacterium]MCH4064475.1 polysaccharide deacetylase [Lachnospiraceae bacterium]MCH4104706.1 polysaccharide deacetylase [Lachnospiraceae bacterium]MCI1308651.1 polysaccharide deacetylase [Lachnospiraceae bacterium]MCI1333320.1 polysaccharide deacetylase [Lachnospiraceae bacterium]
MRKRLIAKTILLAALLVLLVGILIVHQRMTTGGTGDSSSSPAGDTVSTAESAAESTAASMSTSEVPSTADEALAMSKKYEEQYDYDKAISVIESFPGYDQNQDLLAAIQTYTDEKASCVAVDVTTVPHIFFHSLINDDRGLEASVVGEDRAKRNGTAMVTADEFDHIIQDMYDNGYVLVSLDDLCVKTPNADGTTTVTKNTSLLLSEGKKAFVLSEDDLSYYHTYGEGTQGYATKMVLDKKGNVKCEYTDENGDTKIGDYDVAPRLNTFIEKHPDFSYHGARGTIALTGYDGVFGYRTNDYYKDINNPHLDKDQVDWLKEHPDFNWDEDVANATKIANALKAEGWTFASHTYAHWNASEKTADELKADNERWMTVNHNIVGDIDKIIFAFGGDIQDATPYTTDNPKFAYFQSQGYVIYCNVDGNIGWTQFGDTYLRTGRVAMDGYTMYQAMTEGEKSHDTYAHDYQVLGVNDISSFFDQNRITPIESE